MPLLQSGPCSYYSASHVLTLLAAACEFGGARRVSQDLFEKRALVVFSRCRRLFAITIRDARAAFDGLKLFEAGAGQEHAVGAGHVTGCDPMRTDLEMGCFPRCAAPGVDVDRLSCVRAVYGELNGPAWDARCGAGLCGNERCEGDPFSGLRGSCV